MVEGWGGVGRFFFILTLTLLTLSTPSTLITPSHWDDVRALAATHLPPPPSLTVGDVLVVGLAAHRAAVDDVAARAAKEEAVEAKLAAIAAEWNAAMLTFAEYKTRGEVVLKVRERRERGGEDRCVEPRARRPPSLALTNSPPPPPAQPAETAKLLERLEDAQMTLGSMGSNRYATPFRDGVAAWAGRLSAIGETLKRWLAVQNMWTYLEAVFSGGDIVKQLPIEAKRFAGIDRSFVKVVAVARDARSVVAVCVASDLLPTTLPGLLESLELCSKSLTAYLEGKRALFPRFYFVSDPTLLEILSLGSDPAAVVPHFQSGLFDALAGVTFDKKDPLKMIEMISTQGERVKLDAHVDAGGVVEAWLGRLVDGMRSTVKTALRAAVKSAATASPTDLVTAHPAQAALLAMQASWTADTQAALRAASTDKTALARAAKKADATLAALVAATLRDDLTRNARTSLETCITVHMHQKEATDALVRARVRDPSDFEWQKQVRVYWRGDGVVASICDAEFEYSYEYLGEWKGERVGGVCIFCRRRRSRSDLSSLPHPATGIKERLVMTALTDRCYITLSQALSMHLGGAPAGPAGTGKTETTKVCVWREREREKNARDTTPPPFTHTDTPLPTTPTPTPQHQDLGATLGKYVVVFNCSDQMDYKAMGKIFKGLAQSGLWGCFDEFNRINLDVLSVCAQNRCTAC